MLWCLGLSCGDAGVCDRVCEIWEISEVDWRACVAWVFRS